MNSDEINRTIDFILRSQANAATRMDEMERHHWELAETTNRQIAELSASTSRFQEEIRGFIRILVPLLEIQSKRLDRLEGQT
jgi:hypothetical protein